LHNNLARGLLCLALLVPTRKLFTSYSQIHFLITLILGSTIPRVKLKTTAETKCFEFLEQVPACRLCGLPEGRCIWSWMSCYADMLDSLEQVGRTDIGDSEQEPGEQEE
jgi:hypothetical protein